MKTQIKEVTLNRSIRTFSEMVLFYFKPEKGRKHADYMDRDRMHEIVSRTYALVSELAQKHVNTWYKEKDIDLNEILKNTAS